ncbi:hypothetical protein Z517_01902 [Fonsecaea pedrosoi CBS 271.37]|uniref:Uncharacterized protein n=1 Tax=Fonsecaea pedrosoi CBS 271.37 TaxID=1442368 RepID=A0A0D2HPZ6_9EURO|nr:uncharacterized protein Z517_01902 [Fonsecaea pedrosoi CBS 271.37]KIW86504.1 hypothetical protein Z517_01902 [Fonsecaea pedrosoi CBS 271.37]
MEPGRQSNVLQWQYDRTTDPRSGPSHLMFSYYNGGNSLRDSHGEENYDHTSYLVGYGGRQGGYVLPSHGTQAAQYPDQRMCFQEGYHFDQSYMSTRSRFTGQSQYSNRAQVEFPASFSSHIRTSDLGGPLIKPYQGATHEHKRPASPPIPDGLNQDLPMLSQWNTHEESRGNLPHGYGMHSKDSVQALGFSDGLGLEAAKQFSPVQRRIQAFGATMDENDWMEAHQPVIVSKYFRNNKDLTFFRPVRETRHWHYVKDDPAFADIATDGEIVAFEELDQRKNAIVSSHNIAGAYRRPSITVTANVHQRIQTFPEQQAMETGLSIEQEERLAALGVTGVPKPVRFAIPKQEEQRTRSRSPEMMIGQRNEGKSYRQRHYSHGGQAVQAQNWRHDQDPRHRDSQSAGQMISRESEGTGRMGLGHGQDNQRRGRAGKTEGKSRQQHASKPCGKFDKHLHQHTPRPHPPNATEGEI